MSVVKKKKRVSKKNKKAWGKYCDIRDVEEFLEDQRLEERLGKFETKPDSELFVVDTAGDNKDEADDKKPPISHKLQKRAKLKEVPKCFEVLLPTSKVNVIQAALNAAQATSENANEAASQAAGELGAQTAMVGAARQRLHALQEQLHGVRIDFEATQAAARKAQAAAQQAQANAAAAAAKAAAAGLGGQKDSSHEGTAPEQYQAAPQSQEQGSQEQYYQLQSDYHH